MFAGCKNIKNIYFFRFNTKYITNMRCMFLNCINLEFINLLSFDIKKVVDISNIFNNCESLHIPDLSSFDYNSVINEYNLNKDKLYKYEILSSDYSNYDLSFNIILIGESDIGKSRLIKFGLKKESPLSTMGLDCLSFTIRYKNKIINLQIWDTVGQGGRFLSLPAKYFRTASLAIFVYEINNGYSFDFINEIIRGEQHNFSYIKLFLVGNKICINEEE